jgi:hypothetical protein
MPLSPDTALFFWGKMANCVFSFQLSESEYKALGWDN